jgi:hypothetical protein
MRIGADNCCSLGKETNVELKGAAFLYALATHDHVCRIFYAVAQHPANARYRTISSRLVYCKNNSCFIFLY